MANIKSAKKRAKQTVVRNARNGVLVNGVLGVALLLYLYLAVRSALGA